ncbi:4Fe-4S binding protein [Treponema sp. OttesenSCG-928-L16]|nr:4Fe-4S binding protein [Treponema sp. OttesenSCG-928-L16]
MADLYVKEFDMINPFVIASSPATQGARNVLKTAASRPGAVVLRNFGHGAGGGSFIFPDAKAMYAGNAFHSHAVGRQIKDPVSNLEQYCEEVRKIRRELDADIKLWVSVGHYSDIIKGGDWEKEWVRQAVELKNAGADALELHFNTPGVAAAKDRTFNYYQLVSYSTKLIKAAAPDTPLMVKLAVEGCDTLTAMRMADAAGADAVGPTARWKAFYFDLDWRRTQARPGAGYGGTQATPIICHVIAEARSKGMTLPFYAGGGVFSSTQALQIIMAGSQLVQIGALACSGGVSACKSLFRDFASWMDQNGYSNMKELSGDALNLFSMSKDLADERTRRVSEAYFNTQADEKLCTGCGRCVDVCWHEGISIENKKAKKNGACIGCGYCFQVCPVKALHVDSGSILASVFPERL